MLVLIVLILLIAPSAFGAIVFQDNFDNQDDWTITQDVLGGSTTSYYPGNTGGTAPPTGWAGYRNAKSHASSNAGYNLWYLDAIPGYPEESTGTCRGGSGKCLTYWNEATVDSFENSDNPMAIDLGQDYSEIYVRFWIKFQSDWDWENNVTSQQKFYHVQHYEGGCDPFLFFTSGMACNNPISSGGFHTDEGNTTFWYYGEYRCDSNTTDNDHYYCQGTPAYTSGNFGTSGDHVNAGTWATGLGDGDWHEVILHYKLNTNSGSTFFADGEHTMWLDGVQQVAVTSIPWGQDNADTAPRNGFSWVTIGGNNNNLWTMSCVSSSSAVGCEQWYAIDDVVVATTYAEAVTGAAASSSSATIGAGQTATLGAGATATVQ